MAVVKTRLTERRIPFVVDLKDFEPGGVRFEISNPAEIFRVLGHGDETEYTRAMLANLRADDVLYDIGTNVGMVALHAAKRCRTVAFEPDPSFRRRFETNLALNPDRSVVVEPIAVSDRDGTVELYTDGAQGNSPSLVHQRGELGSVAVTARSLDSLLAEGRLPNPTVLKLDIEGAEILALQGAAGLLSGPACPRAIFIEVHDNLLSGFGSTPEEVHALLNNYGYTKTVYRVRRSGQELLILEHSAA